MLQLRASEALRLWHRVSVDLVREAGPDLTLRQLAILSQIYLVAPPHTVRGLAAALNVTKPVITRALDRMGQMGLVDRIRDDDDKRNVIIKRTVKGALYLERLGDLIVASGRELEG